MGTVVKASLNIAELELVGRGYLFDAMVIIVGCDKTIPAGALALTPPQYPRPAVVWRFDRTRPLSRHRRTIQDVFEAIGANAAGRTPTSNMKKYTANCPPSWNSSMGTWQPMPQRHGQCGQLVMDLLHKNIRPLDILTRQAFETPLPVWPQPAGQAYAVIYWPREAEIPLGIL